MQAIILADPGRNGKVETFEAALHRSSKDFAVFRERWLKLGKFRFMDKSIYG